MALYIPAKDDWGQVFENIGRGASEGYQQGADQRALQKAISSLPENATPRQIIDSLTGAKTYNNAAKQEAIKNYMGVVEFEAADKSRKDKAKKDQMAEDIAKANELRNQDKETRAKEAEARAGRAETRNIKEKDAKAIAEEAEIQSRNSLVDQLPEEYDNLKENLKKDPKLANDVIKKVFFGKQPGDDAFIKTIRKDAGEEYVALGKDLAKLQGNIPTLDAVGNLMQDRTLLHSLLSKVYYTQSAKELETMSALLLDPMIKIYNPTGLVAVSKLAFVRNLFQILPTDTPSVMAAKLNTMRHYNKIAIDRGTKRQQLLFEHNGFVPPDELLAFDKESASIMDAMANTELHGVAVPEAEVQALGLPDPSAQGISGKTFDAPDGKAYRSDGSKWVKAEAV